MASFAVLQIDGMTCSACSNTCERALNAMEGVTSAAVSCVTHLAHVEFDAEVVSADALAEEVEGVGFDAMVLEQSRAKATADADVEVPADSGMVSVELRLGGMTCSACSGTIERALKAQGGVSKATVSLVLHKAFVECDRSIVSPEDLQSEVEDIGFDAEVLTVSALDTGSQRGRAHVHVMVRSDRGQAFDRWARGLRGVLGSQTTFSGHKRIVYDPHLIGARQLLAQLADGEGSDFGVRHCPVVAEDEQMQRQAGEMRDLLRTFLFALPLAVVIVFLSLLYPALSPGRLGTFGLVLDFEFHNDISVRTIVVIMSATPVQLVFGRRFHVAALAALKRKSPNMDVLVSVSTNLGYFYSLGLFLFCVTLPQSDMARNFTHATVSALTMGPILITVVLLGKSLEAGAKFTAMRALTDLSSKSPEEAVLCDARGESSIPVELVELGDVLRVFPGGRVPADGTVCSDGKAHMDESLLTGESRPEPKKKGDMVIGGSTCISEGCLLRVSRVGTDTTLGQMCQLVQQAQASKADVQRTADRVARCFVPSVLGLSFLTFLMWATLVFTDCVQVPNTGLHDHTGAMAAEEEIDIALKLLFAMRFGMAVLMIACPCAMGLATPMAVMVATGVAAKQGCLIKSAAALESAAHISTIVLDKTGTLTEGAPKVQAALCFAESFEEFAGAWRAQLRKRPAGITTQQESSRRLRLDLEPAIAGATLGEDDVWACFWWLLGAAEGASDHPVAKCITQAVDSMPSLPPRTKPLNFEYASGLGVRCAVEQLGTAVRVGNMRFYEQAIPREAEPPASAKLRAWVRELQEEGHTVVVLHTDRMPLGAVAMQDPVRENAEWVVAYLTKRLGLEVWLCTGDNAGTAHLVAEQVGIRNVVAEALPATKSECVERLQRNRSGRGRRRFVAFAGDGINDAPALAVADVGIAVGVGAQVTLEAADVTLTRSDLQDCLAFLALSKTTWRTIILNFFWAFCFNFVCLPMAAGLFYPSIHIPPLIAGMGMALSSLLVVSTSLGLKYFKPPDFTKNGQLTTNVSLKDVEKLPIIHSCDVAHDEQATMLGLPVGLRKEAV